MAKCVQLPNGQTKRVSNQEAADLVSKGAIYISKSEWQHSKKSDPISET